MHKLKCIIAVNIYFLKRDLSNRQLQSTCNWRQNLPKGLDLKIEKAKTFWNVHRRQQQYVFNTFPIHHDHGIRSEKVIVSLIKLQNKTHTNICMKIFMKEQKQSIFHQFCQTRSVCHVIWRAQSNDCESSLFSFCI